MIVAAMLMMLAAEAQSGDCAAAAPRGPDFMAMISGNPKKPSGKSLSDHLGGTIVDPPAPRQDIAPGGMAMTGVAMPLPVERAKPAETSEDAEQRARNEAAGICNAGKRPA